MKLIAQLKLLPTPEQAEALREGFPLDGGLQSGGHHVRARAGPRGARQPRARPR